MAGRPAPTARRAGRTRNTRHECSLARVASGGPHDLASAVLRVNEYYCFGRQSFRRASPAGGEVPPKDVCRVGAWLGGQRATEKIYAPTRVTRRITGVSAELRGAEIPRSAPPRRKGPVVILGIEGPDVEVLDAVPFVHVVQGSALAQGPAQRRPAYRPDPYGFRRNSSASASAASTASRSRSAISIRANDRSESLDTLPYCHDGRRSPMPRGMSGHRVQQFNKDFVGY